MTEGREVAGPAMYSSMASSSAVYRLGGLLLGLSFMEPSANLDGRGERMG